MALEQDGYQAYVDCFKIDTVHMLGGITQNFDLAHRDQRVLTKRELDTLWREVFDICRAVESLMHYADKAISAPSPENLVALRKALWRNRNSDDVDPHYEDRFW